MGDFAQLVGLISVTTLRTLPEDLSKVMNILIKKLQILIESLTTLWALSFIFQLLIGFR